MQMGKVPEVPGRSWASIDTIAKQMILHVYPELMKNSSPFPVLNFIEFNMRNVIGYTMAVEELPIYTEAQTDFISKEIIFSEETYDGLCRDEARARFTAMHEVGHAVLHSDFFDDMVSNNRKTKRLSRESIKPFMDPECQANVFAASILMPTNHVVKIIHESDNPVEEIIERFAVSREAASNRVKGIGKFTKK